MKTCKKCGETKPFSGFPKVRKSDNPELPSSYRPNCKPCYAEDKRAARAAARAANPTMPPYNPAYIDPDTGLEVKRCNGCGLVLPVSVFPKSSGNFRPKCRDCYRKHVRDSYWANPEAARKRSRDWAAKNPETVKRRIKQWRVDNRPRLLAYHREHNLKRRTQQREYDRNRRASMSPEKRAAIRDQYLARNKRYQAAGVFQVYRDANRERIRANWRDWARRTGKHADKQQRLRARGKTAIVERVSRMEIIARDGRSCYLCGKPLARHEVTIDHVVPLAAGGTHTADNLRVACRSCNSRKRDLPLAIFRLRYQ